MEERSDPFTPTNFLYTTTLSTSNVAYNTTMAFILSFLAIFVLMVISETVWRRKRTHSEISRKFIHITVGTFVAFWPYFLSATEIKIFSVCFLIVVFVSKYLNIFTTIHSVQRPTRGEFWFALVVGILAFMPHHQHIYTAALLVMSLADGFAAIIGTRYGQAHRYEVFGSTKSVVGTATFFIVAAAILVGYNLATPGALVSLWIVPICLIAAAFENASIRGLDNLAVPLWIAGALYVLA